MPYICSPYVDEAPLSMHVGPLGYRAKARRGVTALIDADGNMTIAREITQEYADSFPQAIRGGYNNVIDDATAAIITAAGHPEWLTEIV